MADLVLVRPMRVAVVIVASLVLARVVAYSDDSEAQHPVQELGTLVYFVPRHHADADMEAYGYGFVAFVLPQVDENDIKPTFIAHSAADFVAAYERLPRKLQQYGIWLTIQKGDPYSADEKATLEELKTLCSKHKLPLSIQVNRSGEYRHFGSSCPGGLTRRCRQPLHRVQPQFSMTNTRSFQSSLAVISGG